MGPAGDLPQQTEVLVRVRGLYPYEPEDESGG